MDALFLWCIVTDEAFSIILVTIFDSIHYIYHQILEYYNMWSVIFYLLNPWNEQGKCHEKVSWERIGIKWKWLLEKIPDHPSVQTFYSIFILKSTMDW